jgi:diacylglycerol kinase family enzyme
MADAGTLPVLLNARAGSRRRAELRRVARALADHGIRAVVEAVEPHDLAAALQRLAGRPAVGVAGGDGTLRTAARALAGTGTALVPFPTGTLNHFARRLSIDTIEAAAQAFRASGLQAGGSPVHGAGGVDPALPGTDGPDPALPGTDGPDPAVHGADGPDPAGGGVRTLPVGRANDRVFLNTAVVGGYAALVELRQRLQPFLTKWPAAALASAILFLRWPRFRLAVRGPEGALHANTPMFWVGVGRGSFPAVHESGVPESEETLEAVAMPGAGRRGGVALSIALLRQRMGDESAVRETATVVRAPWFEVDADGRLPIVLDGEARWMRPPVRIRLEPAALRVVAGVASSVDQYR